MLSNRLAALVLTIGLAACSMPNTALAPSALRNGSAVAKPALDLYVADNNGIGVYTLDGKHLLRSLTGNFFAELAFDKAANLYALAIFHESAWIDVFRPGATTPSYTIGHLTEVQAMAIGPSDNDLYVAHVSFPGMDDGQISVYPSGSATPKRVIHTGNRLWDLAFDGSGNLYALEATPSYSAYFIAVYKPGTSTPFREIQGLENPGTIATDHSGNLYVTNCRSTGKITCSISVYPPGSSQPNTAITNGVSRPYAIAFNSGGALFVGNQKSGGTIAEYAPGAIVPKRIIPGIRDRVPIGLDFNPNGDLYVLRIGRSRGSVTVYTRDMRLQYTIPQLVMPEALAIGPG